MMDVIAFLIASPIALACEIGLFVLLSIFVNQNMFRASMFTIVIMLALFCFLYQIPIWESAKAHAVDIVLYTIGYLVIGGIYAFIDFVSFVFDISHKLTQFCKKNDITRDNIPVKLMAKFKSTYGVYNIPIRMNDYREELLYGTVFWPSYLLWFAIRKPVEWVNRFSKAVLQYISDKAFGDVRISSDSPNVD